MAQTTSNMKRCVTCVYYEGDRQTNNGKRIVKYEAGSKGKCSEKRVAKFATSTCPKWEKWSVLK